MENEKKDNPIEEKAGQADIKAAAPVQDAAVPMPVKKAESVAAFAGMASAPARPAGRGGDRFRDKRGGRTGGRPGGRKGGRGEESRDEFDQKIIDIARVTRVMAGGKRMRFRACVAIGDKKGKVGVGIAKGADVSGAVTKAVNKAKKNLIKVRIVNDTIPHEVRHKFGAAKLLFKPAPEGRGVIAGGAVRAVIELAGIKNIVSKILGTNNKVNNVKCTIEALNSLHAPREKAGAKEIKQT
ncbi:MAG: 30S ribosomal protein S5 [Patescibacteria group bacterium]|jgi:small subunit ribosomal protein S5